MDKTKLSIVFLAVTIIFLAAACGPAPSANVEPTARPYTPESVQEGAGGASSELVGNPEDGKVVFEQYCSECHDIQEGVNIEGPSLFEAGTRYDYNYVKESVLFPTAHLAFIEGEFEVDDSSMPVDFQEWMSAQQLEDVIAYVLSLK
jgi:mono/diheme cytochrome c family protein